MTLAEDNAKVLALGQALLGAITPNFRLVAIRFEPVVEITIVLEHESEADREEAEDIEFEFVALQDDVGRSVKTTVVVNPNPIGDTTHYGRLVYLRKEVREPNLDKDDADIATFDHHANGH
jgi:hypothetical protein